MMSTAQGRGHDEGDDSLTRLGLAIYEDQLKARLEPKGNGQFVAIHVDTEDYAVAPSSGQATRALFRRHSIDGRVVVRKIGPEPEYGLLARMSAGELMDKNF